MRKRPELKANGYRYPLRPSTKARMLNTIAAQHTKTHKTFIIDGHAVIIDAD